MYNLTIPLYPLYFCRCFLLFFNLQVNRIQFLCCKIYSITEQQPLKQRQKYFALSLPFWNPNNTEEDFSYFSISHDTVGNDNFVTYYYSKEQEDYKITVMIHENNCFTFVTNASSFSGYKLVSWIQQF